jgi:hypothetical protein
MTAAALVVLFAVAAAAAPASAPRRILVDTDMDTDDLLALLYILKQDRSEFDVKVGATICPPPSLHASPAMYASLDSSVAECSADPIPSYSLVRIGRFLPFGNGPSPMDLPACNLHACARVRRLA